MNEQEDTQTANQLETVVSGAQAQPFCDPALEMNSQGSGSGSITVTTLGREPDGLQTLVNPFEADTSKDAMAAKTKEVDDLSGAPQDSSVDDVFVETNAAFGEDFEMSSTGLVKLMFDRHGNAQNMWICDPFLLIAEVRNFDNADRGLKLIHVDREGHPHPHVISHEDLAVNPRKVFGQLATTGLRLSTESPARRALRDCLLAAQPAVFIRFTKRVGFQPDGAFVLPKMSIGTNETVEFQTLGGFTDQFLAAGSLEGWRENVSQIAVGNPFVLFAIATAFVGPLLRQLSAESPIFHLWGPSSTGKTTSARLAASVWGTPTGFVGTWRATINAMESVQDGRNDTLVVLDELGLADPTDVKNAAYMISTGQGKARMTKTSSLSPSLNWSVATLSTGEVPFETYIASAGQTVAAGQTVRFISIRADAGKENGIWSDLRGFGSGHELALAAKHAADEQHGTAGVEFVRRLMPILPTIPELHATEIAILSANLPPDADGQVRRVCNTFATVALAGRLAARLGIVAWTEEDAVEAAALCFNSWLNKRGHTGAFETESYIAMIRSRLAAAMGNKIGYTHNTREKYQTGDDDEYTTKIYGAWGFARFDAYNRGIFVRTRAFKEEVSKGMPTVDVLRELAKRGHLITSNEEFEKVMHDPLTRAKARCYRFDVKFLELPTRPEHE